MELVWDETNDKIINEEGTSWIINPPLVTEEYENKNQIHSWSWLNLGQRKVCWMVGPLTRPWSPKQEGLHPLPGSGTSEWPMAQFSRDYAWAFQSFDPRLTEQTNHIHSLLVSRNKFQTGLSIPRGTMDIGSGSQPGSRVCGADAFNLSPH